MATRLAGAMHMGALDEAESDQQDQHGGAAVAYQGERDADNGGHAHDHRHIHGEEQKEGCCNAEDQQRRKPIPVAQGGDDAKMIMIP